MSSAQPSSEQLAALVAELTARLDQAETRIEALEAENAALRARLGKDSTNSSIPPSQDPLGAKARRKVAASQRVRSKDRKRGGQPGRAGSGLAPTSDPSRTERVAAPVECVGCGAGLDNCTDAEATWAQVWDVKPVEWEKVHYVLPRRRCEGCGRLNTPTPPFAQAGAVTYGPSVNTAAVLLGSQGNVPVAATAALMEALLGAPVSTGFVARAQHRLADTLERAGFDEAMVSALRAEDVLCADETPVNVVNNINPDTGRAATGAPHVVTVRTPDERLVWYAGITARTSGQLAGLRVFGDWRGVLVRDDYAGWHQFDTGLGGVQQCGAHLRRHLKGVAGLDADNHAWATQVDQALCDGAALAATARAGPGVNAAKLSDARWRYDHGVRIGISINLSRPWPKGSHPGLVLARRLQAKADQVWLFTTRPDVPWTNNASEQALKSPKLHQKVSGYWQTTITLARFCRLRAYLVSARNHGIRAADAIRAALAGNPWLPPLPAVT